VLHERTPQNRTSPISDRATQAQSWWCGAGIGSIYHHFGGKKELFLTIFDRLTA
jgi:AcrR family transcriptional regulator